MKELQYKAEKHDYGNISKSLKIDKDYYGNNYKKLNRKKTCLLFLKFY